MTQDLADFSLVLLSGSPVWSRAYFRFLPSEPTRERLCCTPDGLGSPQNPLEKATLMRSQSEFEKGGKQERLAQVESELLFLRIAEPQLIILVNLLLDSGQVQYGPLLPLASSCDLCKVQVK